MDPENNRFIGWKKTFNARRTLVTIIEIKINFIMIKIEFKYLFSYFYSKNFNSYISSMSVCEKDLTQPQSITNNSSRILHVLDILV